jgi:cytochrome bd ubiquinol oxidase subunit I
MTPMSDAVVLLSRIQFALTIAFHYLYPPLSIGLGVFLVLAEARYLQTRDPLWRQVARFWTRVFALTFAIGVATGLVMEFEFGTNWSKYSRFVGDVFGSALAAEGIFAFFLESGFLALLLFGWEVLPPRVHFFSTVMVCLGAHFSAIWIVVANSWMHTPAGFHIVNGPSGPRAEIVDFWAMVFNPSSVTRLTHVVLGAWLAGAFLVLSVSAWYLLKRRHETFALASIRVATGLALAACVLQVWAGHHSALIVARHQPVKFAALEGHYATGPADLTIAGWVDQRAETTRGFRIPGGTSWLLYGDPAVPVAGLNEVALADRPPVQPVFQAYRAMVAIGFSLLAVALVTAVQAWRGRLARSRALLWVLVFAVIGPQIANQAGWMAAEVGRQPWIVQGLMRTAEGVSPLLTSGQVIFSLTLFGVIYALLFAVFVFLLNDKIQHGPEPVETAGALAMLPGRLIEVLQQRKQDV